MTGALRKVMEEFIRVDGRQIELHRPSFEKTSTGGYVKGSFQTLPPQLFRLVPYKRRLTDLTTVKADGEIPYLPYVLICMPSVDVQRMDEFYLDNVYYRIQEIEPHTNNRETTDRVVSQLISLQPEAVTWL